MFEEQKIKEINQAVLVGLNCPGLSPAENASEDSLEELAALLDTAGGTCLGTVLQNKNSPDPRTFIGVGKAAEVQLFVENTQATMVIFDNDLSPSQMRVLTELLGVQVLDRCGLILEMCIRDRARSSCRRSAAFRNARIRFSISHLPMRHSKRAPSARKTAVMAPHKRIEVRPLSSPARHLPI